MVKAGRIPESLKQHAGVYSMKFKITLLTLSSCLAFTACEIPSANYFPDGYYWHDDTPISSPPQTADWYERAYEEAPKSIRYALTATLHGMAKDMVSAFSEQSGPYGTPIYLTPRYDIDVVNGAYDEALRSAFRDFGYTLSNTSEGSTQIVYHASTSQKASDHRFANPQSLTTSLGIIGNTKDYLFSLVQIGADGTTVLEEARLQPLPNEDTASWSANYHDYERPGLADRSPSYERD